MRPSSWVEIDLSALHRNATRLMSSLDPETKVFAVLKGDAYGIGLDAAVDTLARAGVSGFAAGTIDEGLRAKQLRPDIPVLVYGTYPPSAISEVAGSGLILTAYSPECVSKMIETDKPLDLMIKVDCGFGRLGIPESELDDVLGELSGKPLANVLGLYTHIGAIDDDNAVGIQVARFREAARVAEGKLGRTNLWLMAASSRIVLDRPGLQFNMINPGRMLYGLLESPWRERNPYLPVFRAVKGRLMQVKTLRPGRQYGYGMSTMDRKINVGIVPFGFALGLPRAIEGLDVLVRKKPAKVLGLAGMEQVVLDLSNVPDAAPEDEVVLFDSRTDCSLTADSFSEKVGLTPLEILPRLGRSLPRVYRQEDAIEVR